MNNIKSANSEYERMSTFEMEDGFNIRFFRNLTKGCWSIGDLLYMHGDYLNDYEFEALKELVGFYPSSKITQLVKEVKREAKRVTYHIVGDYIYNFPSSAAYVLYLCECVDMRMKGLRPVQCGKSVTKWINS